MGSCCEVLGNVQSHRGTRFLVRHNVQTRTTYGDVIVDAHCPAIELDQSVDGGQLAAQLALILTVFVRVLGEMKVVDGERWGRRERLVLPNPRVCVQRAVRFGKVVGGRFGGANLSGLHHVGYFAIHFRASSTAVRGGAERGEWVS